MVESDLAVEAASMAAAAAAPARPVFAEPLGARLRRWTLGTGYALKPERIGLVPRVAMLAVQRLAEPAARRDRLADGAVPYGEQGLVGISEDLSVRTVLARYRQGLYPLSHIGPLKWWSPETRAVLRPAETQIESKLRKLMRKQKYIVTFDTAFADVIRACAMPRDGKTPLTWITPKMMNAFWDLHRAGHAHSVEVWDQDGVLVGGSYGLAVGEVYFSESRFASARDASKIAVATLDCHLAHWGFVLRDAKFMSGHLENLGFWTMNRAAFDAVLAAHAWRPGRVGRWRVDAAIDVSKWQPAKRAPEGPAT